MAKEQFKATPDPAWAEYAGSFSFRPGSAASGVDASVAGEQAQILSLLYEIGQELTSILDLNELLHAIGEHVKRLADYDLFSVMLLNSETQRLEHTLSLRYDERLQLRTTLALGQGLCGTAALERRAIRVSRVAVDPRYIRCESGLAVESELVVPLIFQDRLLGVLDLESLAPDAFTELHERMLTMMAPTVAIALENARLYDQLRRAEQRRTEDLERARVVQQLLLPKGPPSLPGVDIGVLYMPAQELGGDFYDFQPYGDGRIAVAVGDVAGKGPAAALLASLGIGILREHAVHHVSNPAELLADLNGHLLVAGENARFIALALSIYNPATRELLLANAGFPQPVLVRNGRPEPLEIAGVPLGLFPGSIYDSLSVQLQPGDAVVYCSDGIHEQSNALGEEFGLERLSAQLAKSAPEDPAQVIAADVVRAAEEYSGEAAACQDCRDDRTIVVLRIAQDGK